MLDFRVQISVVVHTIAQIFFLADLFTQWLQGVGTIGWNIDYINIIIFQHLPYIISQLGFKIIKDTLSTLSI